jgi:hypothetical protein
VFAAHSAFDGCVAPAQPMLIPDGATASMDQMRAARAAVAAYDSATNDYNKCLDAATANTAQQDQGAASPAIVRAVNALGVEMHNAAVEKDQALAARMNQQIRIYKARHSP